MISHLPNVDTKTVTKEGVIKELHNLRELRRMTTGVLKERDLKLIAIIAGRRATCLEIVGPRKIRRKQCGILQHGDGGEMGCRGTICHRRRRASTHGDDGRPYKL